MPFVDEIEIEVLGGKGGPGCLSFLREKFRPYGGPDGGNGGHGGSVFLRADSRLHTLVDYRFQKIHRAPNGMHGSGQLRSGRQGEDIILPVPVGTLVYDRDTGLQIGDLKHPQDLLCVARGGDGGFGNAHFKSSTNRAPRKTIPGFPGEHRRLRLELRLLADVGLLGLPNAGKSTLIRAVSKATPKVADYPFTTLHPELGVVSCDRFRSFVLADLPGLIEGAHEGTGLGIRFLKHLFRNRLLLHVVDLYPFDEHTEVIPSIRMIEKELLAFDPALFERPRWLVFNKCDLAPSIEDAQKDAERYIQDLGWDAPWFCISAQKREGTDALMQEVMNTLDALKEKEASEASRTLDEPH